MNVAKPRYQQLKDLIIKRISAGELRPSDRVPSENELVEAMNVSRMTANRALRELTQEGLIQRVHGLGSFVAEAPRHASLIELQDIALEIAQRGKRHHARILQQEIVNASAQIAAQLELPVAQQVFHLRVVHFQDDIPIQLESRYVHPAAMPDFMAQDFSRITPTAYLLEQFKPDEMEHRVSAVMPDAQTRELLGMQGGQPCLQLIRRTWHQQQVVTHVTLTYPGDRYELGARYATNEYQLR